MPLTVVGVRHTSSACPIPAHFCNPADSPEGSAPQSDRISGLCVTGPSECPAWLSRANPTGSLREGGAVLRPDVRRAKIELLRQCKMVLDLQQNAAGGRAAVV